MRKRLISEVDWSFQSQKANIVLDDPSRPTEEELGVNIQLCLESFGSELNRLCVIIQIVIP